MFSQPFFSTPMGSQSFYREPSFAPAPRASYFYEDPFSFGGFQPAYRQPAYRRVVEPTFSRPVYRNYRYDDSSDEEEEGYGYYPGARRETCTCGRCSTSTPARRRAGAAPKPASAAPSKSKVKAGTSDVSSPPMKKSAIYRRSSEEQVASESGSSSDESTTQKNVGSESIEGQGSVSPAVEDNIPAVSPVESEAETTSTDETAEDAAEAERLHAQVLASFSNASGIAKDIESIRAEVEQFNGTKESKDYLRLEDTLTRVLLRLDMVESYGDEKVRSVRRKAVVDAQSVLDLLESRVVTATPVLDQHSAVVEDAAVTTDEDIEADMDTEEHDTAESVSEDGVLVDDVESDSDNLNMSLLFGE